MKSEEKILEMRAAKKHEDPEKVEGYLHGHRDGFRDALKWVMDD